MLNSVLHSSQVKHLLFVCTACGQQRRYGEAVPLDVDFARRPFIECQHCGHFRIHDFVRIGRIRNGNNGRGAQGSASL